MREDLRHPMVFMAEEDSLAAGEVMAEAACTWEEDFTEGAAFMEEEAITADC